MPQQPPRECLAQPAENVTWTCIDDEAILLNLTNGFYYTLNQVGCEIWKCLDGKRTRAEISTAICAQFAVEPAQAAADIDALLTDLERERLIICVETE